MTPVSAEHLRSLKLGDTFQTTGILVGITDEPIKWRLIAISNNRTEFEFDLTYFGASLGSVAALIRGNKVDIEDFV